MALYLPSHFAATDRASVVRLMHDHPFATLVTADPLAPLVTHLPLVHVADAEPHGTLVGHFARANPHWRVAASAASTAIFHGPHHYVSPSWYESPDEAVPTWNYVVVHAHGELQTLDSRAQVEGVLRLMIDRFEAQMPSPRSPSLPERRLATLIDGIVAFRFRIRRLEAKFKLGQNRTVGDRARVVDALASLGSDASTSLAEWTRRYAGA